MRYRFCENQLNPLKNMKKIAIITARGGSKRIPRKNIKEFMGKPMLSYAVSAALQSRIFDEIMVSTDDTEIADMAKKYGANVPFMRSEKTANDYAGTVDVLLEVLDMYRHHGDTFDELCCIYPCVPFLTPDMLRQAHREFSGHAALIPVCRYSEPIEWAMTVKDGCLVPHDVHAQSIRSQDLVPKYYDVGMFYYATTVSLEQSKTLVPTDTKAFFVDAMRCHDIDTPEDWKIAEMKYRLQQQLEFS